MMFRSAFSLLAVILLLAGCGEADHSRVIPVTDADLKPRPTSHLTPEQTTLKKIPMH